MADDRDERPGGMRQDGRPYKHGNTREDGSYDVGKGRPPSHGQFAVGDGRKRGKRPKGSKNISTIWARKLKQKIRHEGKEQTAAEWLIEGLIRRGISRSDRAAETALSEAGRLEHERKRQVSQSDADIIDAWLAQRRSDASDVSDDRDCDDGLGATKSADLTDLDEDNDDEDQ